MAEFDPKELERPIKYCGLRSWALTVAWWSAYLGIVEAWGREPELLIPLFSSEYFKFISPGIFLLSMIPMVIFLYLGRYRGKKLSSFENLNFTFQIIKAHHFLPLLYLAIFIALFELWIYLN